MAAAARTSDAYDGRPDPSQRGSVAVFASVVLHVLLIGLVVIVGFDVAGGTPRKQAPLMVADWTPPPIAGVTEAPPDLPVPGGARLVAGPAARARVSTETAAANAAAQLDRLAPVNRSSADAPAPRLARTLGFGAAPATASRTAGFAAERSRVAFVIDAGGLMVPVLQSALRELGRHLTRLNTSQTYVVIVARGDGCETVPGTPAKATRESVERTMRWLAERTQPRGESNLAKGLECAWTALDPDAVCMLSRGAKAPMGYAAARASSDPRTPQESVLATADRLNPATDSGRKALFLCLELLDASPSGELHALGQSHGGPRGYMLLDRNELGLAPRPVPGRSSPAPRSTP
jgi:hypothetical protein